MNWTPIIDNNNNMGVVHLWLSKLFTNLMTYRRRVLKSAAFIASNSVRYGRVRIINYRFTMSLPSAVTTTTSRWIERFFTTLSAVSAHGCSIVIIGVLRRSTYIAYLLRRPTLGVTNNNNFTILISCDGETVAFYYYYHCDGGVASQQNRRLDCSRSIYILYTGLLLPNHVHATIW